MQTFVKDVEWRIVLLVKSSTGLSFIFLSCFIAWRTTSQLLSILSHLKSWNYLIANNSNAEHKFSLLSYLQTKRSKISLPLTQIRKELEKSISLPIRLHRHLTQTTSCASLITNHLCMSSVLTVLTLVMVRVTATCTSIHFRTLILWYTFMIMIVKMMHCAPYLIMRLW